MRRRLTRIYTVCHTVLPQWTFASADMSKFKVQMSNVTNFWANTSLTSFISFNKFVHIKINLHSIFTSVDLKFHVVNFSRGNRRFYFRGYKQPRKLKTREFCLCWGFTAQSTQWGHVERGQFT